MTSQKTAAEETTGAGGGEGPFHFCNPQKCIESNDMIFNLKPRGRVEEEGNRYLTESRFSQNQTAM